MRIKLDENLPVELADDLRAVGHDVESVVTEGLSGRSDGAIVSAVRRERRTLFTLDKGIGDLRRFSSSNVAYSIFECQFPPTDLVRCRHALGEIIDHREDQVLFVDLGPVEGRGDRVITALGKAYSPFDSPCIVGDGERA